MTYIQPSEYSSPPLHGYTDSTFDPVTGYTHTHSYYADVYGTYERTFDEERGPAFDRSYQNVQNYTYGQYTTDILNTTTPLDGQYQSYGTRYTSTYDLNDHTLTINYVTFQFDYSSSIFKTFDYENGALIVSYDTRSFFENGYYEYTSSRYAGPEGSTSSAGGMYHYSP